MALETTLKPVEVEVLNEATELVMLPKLLEVDVLNDVSIATLLDRPVEVLVLNEPIELCAPSIPCST
jgi:hypothetical protein